MPQVTEVDYVDGEIKVNENEPSTVAELTEMIGEEAVVENVNANLRYRNKYPRVYRKVSAALVAVGKPRAQKKDKDGALVEKKSKDGIVTTVLVDPIEHLRQVIAEGEEGKALVLATLTPIAQGEPMYVKGERAGGGGKVSKAAEDAANAKFAAGDAAVESAITIIEENVPGYKVGRDPEGNATPESLARGIQALQKKLAADAAEKAKGLLV